eukprot:CAMPEP_0195533372 /NCGR_PEP_ID=MMETSP0794_2-20130614/40344_1 /TAXON_ID=515487 /ORGANISM="Stephanopyxis turris, Strain CCMP 815" /LENGTH=328 /DNA_ID=CAMNT_0040665871 /DNA_START=21 /DNA_END=1007 /DNA_ORIENTATION=-
MEREDELKTKLTEERMNLLLDLGFQFQPEPPSSLNLSGSHDRKKKEQQQQEEVAWNKRMDELRQYKAIHGNCDVPRRYTPNPQLGAWVHMQQKAYKNLILQRRNSNDDDDNNGKTLNKNNKYSSLTEQRRVELESVGFTWNICDVPPSHQQQQNQNNNHDAVWNTLFEELKLFQTKHGHTRVPQSSSYHYGSSEALGNWVYMQQTQYHMLQNQQQQQEGNSNSNNHTSIIITEEQITKLNTINFEWYVDNFESARSAFHDTWNNNLQNLAAFKNEHGHSNVPQDYGVHHELGQWVQTQRRFYELKKQGKASLLTEERMRDLDALDLSW